MRQVVRTNPERILQSHEDRIGAIERSGSDPTEWVYVGSGSPAPAFQNGFANVGGSYAPMRYRFLRPADPTLDPSVHQPNAIEIQGGVTGGALGDVIFTLLQPRYLPDGTPAWVTVSRDYTLHLPASDDAGGFVVFTVTQSGDVVYGFV